MFSTSATYKSGSFAFLSQTTSFLFITITSVFSIFVPASLVSADKFKELPASFDLTNETSTVNKEPHSKNIYDEDDEPVWDGKLFYYAVQSFHWKLTLVDTVYGKPTAKDVELYETHFASVVSPPFSLKSTLHTSELYYQL